MQHEPSGLLGHTDSAVYFIRANTVLAVDEHPKSDHPLIEAEWRFFKYSADLDAELLPAFFAFPSALSLEIPVLLLATSRTGRFAIRPTHRGHSVYANPLV